MHTISTLAIRRGLGQRATCAGLTAIALAVLAPAAAGAHRDTDAAATGSTQLTRPASSQIDDVVAWRKGELSLARAAHPADF